MKIDLKLVSSDTCIKLGVKLKSLIVYGSKFKIKATSPWTFL